MQQTENTAHWNTQATDIDDEDLVTHPDLYQKILELDWIGQHLEPDMHVLEVGCGNGYVTNYLLEQGTRVDGFDAAPEMIPRATTNLEKKGHQLDGRCRLFVDRLPSPGSAHLAESYDLVISVRVLINLPSQESQAEAIEWIASKLRPGGVFLYLEGCDEGLDAVNAWRTAGGLNAIPTAQFNINLPRTWMEETASQWFDIADRGHMGVYDFLTRFYYPLVVGGENVEYNTRFQEAAYRAARARPEDESLAALSRMHMLKLVKR